MDEYGIYSIKLDESAGAKADKTGLAVLVRTVPETEMCIVIPITKNSKFSKLPYAVPIEEGTNAKVSGTVLVSHILTINKAYMVEPPIDKLNEAQIRQIKTLLKDVLQLT